MLEQYFLEQLKQTMFKCCLLKWECKMLIKKLELVGQVKLTKLMLS